MTNSSNDRLDQIEGDFETIKEVLFTVARRYEAAADRMVTTDERIERLGQRTDERLERLAQRQERTQEQLDELREDVNIAFQTVRLMAENADKDRALIVGLQTENRRIWEYLMRRDRNGNGDQP